MLFILFCKLLTLDMNKPQFLCKLLRNLNDKNSIKINPESPLFINKNRQKKSEEIPLSPSDSLHLSTQQKQCLLVNSDHQMSDKGSESKSQKLDKFSFGVKKHESGKFPFRRVVTVPSNSQEKCRKSQTGESVEINPALMIRQLKLHSLGDTSEQQKSIGKKLEQIQIRLGWGSIRKKSLNRQNFTNRGNILNKVIFHSENEGFLSSSKTATNFRSEDFKPDRSRKGNFKITLFKQDSPRSKLKEGKIISLSCSKPFLPPPKITAKSFIVYKTSTKDKIPQTLLTSNSKNRQEIASLTKVMTAILVIEICRLISVDIYAEEVIISTFQEGIPGTTAEIREGEVYTIEQLLHGLMLPSGNDASVALAVWGGLKLLQFFPEANSPELKENEQSRERCYRRFIKEMNLKALSLKMRKTSYMNSHGLSNSQSKSCAYDMALLCDYCMKNETFRNVVSCPLYISSIRNRIHFWRHEGRRLTCSSLKHMKVQWQNTHELVRRYPDQYIGIKTGFTYTAGPCLASCLSINKNEYLIIVLGCETMSMRFRDTELLKKWVEGHVEERK